MTIDLFLKPALHQVVEVKVDVLKEDVAELSWGDYLLWRSSGIGWSFMQLPVTVRVCYPRKR